MNKTKTKTKSYTKQKRSELLEIHQEQNEAKQTQKGVGFLCLLVENNTKLNEHPQNKCV